MVKHIPYNIDLRNIDLHKILRILLYLMLTNNRSFPSK